MEEYANTRIREDAKIVRGEFAKNFRDLKVYRVAYDLSLALHKASLEFPKIEQYSLANQLRRSSKSICANIAEGYGKQRLSKAEFRRFLFIALGSCDETSLWLDYCRDLAYVSSDQYALWQDRLDHTEKMIHKLIQNLEG